MGDRVRAVVQRVSRAEVRVGGEVAGAIGPGLLVLLGVARDDARRRRAGDGRQARRPAIFEDAAGKMNLAVAEVAGGLLVVSQFTLLGDGRKGNRPSFVEAAPPEAAERALPRGSARSCARRGSRSRPGCSGPRWRSSW